MCYTKRRRQHQDSVGKERFRVRAPGHRIHGVSGLAMERQRMWGRVGVCRGWRVDRSVVRGIVVGPDWAWEESEILA